MPAFANIVINDGAGSPAAHTFSPTSRSPDGVCAWHDRSVANAIGQHYIVHKYKSPATASAGQASNANERVYSVDWNVAYIVLESTSAATGTGIPPAPTVAYVTRANASFKLPERSIAQDRKHARMFLINLLSHATPLDTIENLTTITG